MTPRRVVVTGLGVAGPHGTDAHAAFARLMKGESAIRVISFGTYSNIGAPAEFDPAQHFPDAQKADHLDRTAQLSVTAARLALAEAGVELTDDLKRRSGVSYGTGMGSGLSLEATFEQALLRDPQRIRPLTVLKVMNNAPAGHIAMQYGFSGPDLTYSCACASSAVSIGEAFRTIRHGYADLMVAGGAEASLTPTFFRAWDAMHVLAPRDKSNPAASCRPFSKNRSGLVLGEGAAMIVLEEREAALRRGARIYAELAGYASSNERTHITRPTVEGQALAMELALQDAGMNGEDIDYVNAHGTATQLNDGTETQALKKALGSHAYRIPVSSTKSMHGHLLGGAGALEFAISLLAIRHQGVPPTANLEVRDPECDLDYVAGEGREQRVRSVMSNSFAFGGTNAVLIARGE